MRCNCRWPASRPCGCPCLLTIPRGGTAEARDFRGRSSAPRGGLAPGVESLPLPFSGDQVEAGGPDVLESLGVAPDHLAVLRDQRAGLGKEHEGAVEQLPRGRIACRIVVRAGALWLMAPGKALAESLETLEQELARQGCGLPENDFQAFGAQGPHHQVA